jgi:uncharacterized protein (TIGR02266 family)
MSDPQKDRPSPAALKVRYKSANVDEFIRQSNKDISLVGIFIKTKTPIKEGVPLKIELQLENGTPLICGVGQVTWCREIAQSEERPSGMGIKFLKLDSASRQVIERAVKARGQSPSRFDRLGNAAARETSEGGEPIHKRTSTPLVTHAAGIFSSEKPPPPPESTPDSVSGFLSNEPFKSPVAQEKLAPTEEATEPDTLPGGGSLPPREPSGGFSSIPPPREYEPPPQPPLPPPALAPREQEGQPPDTQENEPADIRVRALEQELFSDLNAAFERLDNPTIAPIGALSDLIPTIVPGAPRNGMEIVNIVSAQQDKVASAKPNPVPPNKVLSASRAVADGGQMDDEPLIPSSFEEEKIEAGTYSSADKGEGQSSAGAIVEEQKTSPFYTPQKLPDVPPPSFAPMRSGRTPPVSISRLYRSSETDSGSVPSLPLSKGPGDTAASLPPRSANAALPAALPVLPSRSPSPIDATAPIRVSQPDAQPPKSPQFVDAAVPIGISQPEAQPPRPPLFIDAAAPIGVSQPGARPLAQPLKIYVIAAIVLCAGLVTAIYIYNHGPSSDADAAKPSIAVPQSTAHAVAKEPAAGPATSAPAVDVLVTSIPENALVTVAGTPMGQTPVKVPLPLGTKVRVEAAAPGFAKMAMEVTARKGQHPLSFILSRLAYQLTVQSYPTGAMVMARGMTQPAPIVFDLGQVKEPFFVIVAKTGYKKQVLQLRPEQFVERDGSMRYSINVTLTAVSASEKALSDTPTTVAPAQAPAAPHRQIVLLKPEEPAEAPKEVAPNPAAAPANTPPAEIPPANPYGPTGNTPPTQKTAKPGLPENPF